MTHSSDYCDKPRERNHNISAEPLIYLKEWRSARDSNPQPFDPERNPNIFYD